MLANHLQACMGQPVAAGGLQFIGEVSLKPRRLQYKLLCSAAGYVALPCCHCSQALTHSSWQTQCTCGAAEWCIPYCLLAALFMSSYPPTGCPHLLSHPPDIRGLFPAPGWGCDLGPCLIPIPLGDRGGVPCLCCFHSHEEGTFWVPGRASHISPSSEQSQLREPAAVHLWALLCFLQVFKACEKQRRKESSPSTVSMAGECVGSLEVIASAVGSASALGCSTPLEFEVRPRNMPSLGQGCVWGIFLALTLVVLCPGAHCSSRGFWRL